MIHQLPFAGRRYGARLLVLARMRLLADERERDEHGRYVGSGKDKPEKVIKTKGTLPPGLKAWLDKKAADKAAAGKAAPESKPESKPVITAKPVVQDTPPPESLTREGARAPIAIGLNQRADAVAAQMGFPANRIDVISGRNARSFQVAGNNCTEAGHYDPTTGRIQVNDAVIKSGRDGILIHEVAHAQFDYAEMQANHEMMNLGNHAYGDHKEMWTKSGTIRVDKRDEVLAKNPALKAFHEAGLGHYAFGGGDIAAVAKDDGTSTYSSMYWKAAEGTQSNNRYSSPATRSAVNETLSETARINGMSASERDSHFGIRGRMSWNGDTLPAARFTKLRDDIAKIYTTRDKNLENKTYANRQYARDLFRKY